MLGSRSTLRFGRRKTDVHRTSCARRGSLWLLSLVERTAASQAAEVGFKSHRSYCGYSITVSTADCGSAHPGSIFTPFRSVLLSFAQPGPLDQRTPVVTPRAGSVAANAADCKSVTPETSKVRVLPCPFLFACPFFLTSFLR